MIIQGISNSIEVYINISSVM